MPGRSPADAVARFLDTVQRALSCITDSVAQVSHGGRTIVGRPHVLTLGVEPVPLRTAAGRARLLFKSTVGYEITERHAEPRAERYKVRTTQYLHHIYGPDESHEVLLFHWHPVGGRHGPHLHVGTGEGGALSRRAHVPTGRVPLESVVRFLITELGAEPRRPDWLQVLNDCEAAFWRFATWKGAPPDHTP